MIQEEKQLLLKDLCARLPYWVFVNVTEPGDSSTNYDCLLSTDILKEVSGKTSNLNYKPYLRPMSSMTEEEKKEYKSFFRIGEYTCGGSLYGEEYEYIDADSDDISQPTSLIDWLNAHHFDFRGLIEKGLALESPENMYKED